MYNDFERGSMSNALALHYFEEETVDAKSLFCFIEDWISKQGLTPTKMGGKGNKSITFSRGKKALEKENFKGIQEQGIWIIALPPENKVGTETFDFLMAGAMDCEDSFKENTCKLCWDEQIIPWENAYIKNLAKDLYQFCKPKYGYAFQREFEKGPIYYSGGIIAGVDYSQKKERQEITNWGIVGQNEKHSKYQPHMIRDVYPLNFLSPQHLKAKIGSQTLQEWIQSDPSHGSLEKLLPDFWCWSVDEKHIESVKEDLKPHNFLIAHMEF
ncbi:MAG: hypothetical protein GW748_06630 [Alphaproteobacteria bacterium]|nr:hypothetical protein [Alphaproteobacteria bacterium]NCQ67402.1 hypothetical protein [Alphaproteobacteria bacterium]NCT08021.1 hypothetical protein [Alphaproteobacteria bacterium]